MRSVRILLVAIALLRGRPHRLGVRHPRRRVLGARDTATATTAAPQVDPAAAPAPAPAPAPRSTTRLRRPGPAAPTPTPPRPPPRPRGSLGFGSEPVLPNRRGVLRAVLRSRSPHHGGARRPTRHQGRVLAHPDRQRHQPTSSRKIGQDSNGRDGWLFNWHYPNEPILGHLTVKAVGPGGTAEKTVGVYHATRRRVALTQLDQRPGRAPPRGPVAVTSGPGTGGPAGRPRRPRRPPRRPA